MSSLFRPPSLVNSLMPLRLKGRWLAVIMTAPSQSISGSRVVMNMAGVVAMPQSYTWPPSDTSPRQTACARFGPVSRLSRPTATLRLSFPVFAFSHLLKE